MAVNIQDQLQELLESKFYKGGPGPVLIVNAFTSFVYYHII